MQLNVNDLNEMVGRARAHLPQLLCAAALVAAAPVALSAGGCGGASRGSSSASTESNLVTGPVTIVNQSQFEICRLELILDSGAVTQDVQLSTGDSATLDVQARTNRLYVTECGGERSLLGHPMNWYGSPQGRSELMTGLQQDRIVLYDPGQAPADATDHRALDLNPRPISDRLFFEPNTDSGLAEDLHSALVAHAQRGGWSETFEFSMALGEWNTLRNRYTSIVTGRSVQSAGFARWPDGHCTMQAFGFEQSHNGSDFSGPLAVGVSTQLSLPCAALAYAAGRPGASANSASSGVGGGASSGGGAASSGGGSCTNTCNSSNDGECDDGGPNSLYDICALGTDCADCGAR
jgi:uncharacterized membrane protein YgcG